MSQAETAREIIKENVERNEKPTKGATIGIHFGALCKPIKEQLEKQGYTIAQEDSAFLQELADMIVMLHLHRIIPDSVRDNANKKLMAKIMEKVSSKS